MTGRYRIALARIADELDNLDQVYERFQKKQEKKNAYEQDDICSIFGLILHDFYNVLENIFLIVARDIDESIPQGGNWHRDLAEQMCLAIPEIRPALLSKDLGEKLAEYRSFRHIIHHTYGFQLVWSRMEHLVNELPEIYREAKKQIIEFIKYFSQPGL
ncbi:hypothetical protein [Carboxydocella sp. JDF658]|uniref:ribonuclease toxin HepT-like protein n=1 Tax=Carboxydocella sp. JDF658 TaxID=1926600 RepID=UPI0009AE0E6A|nr:hypothetical protein [Carboxydocella sp. JDF658]GAW31879.1 hypothetical protein JDF658_16440 [Carboxydocella sp. JDF658]